MEATELVMQCARANRKQKQQLVFVKEWKYGRTPTNMVQGQLKLQFECLTKHMADADIPNTNTSLSAKSSIGENIESYSKVASPRKVGELAE